MLAGMRAPTIREKLLADIAAHLERTGETEAEFGKAIGQNKWWVPHLREGSATLITIERAERYIAGTYAEQDRMAAE
jgi:hypothetical protein